MHTSFIPKKTYNRKKKTKRNYSGFLMVVAGFIFILSILSAGGLFLYNRYLTSEIDTMAESLDREKGSLEKKIIRELSRIDTKIKVAQEILNNHIILTPLFDLLEKKTLPNVQFENLSLTPSPQGEGWVIEMDGKADSYATIALQSDIFEEDSNLSELVFSNLGIGTEGGVVFTVNAKVDSRLFSYRNSLD